MQRLSALLEEQQYQGFREALTCAEIAEDISEFHALRFRAILAMIEESGDSDDYLELAETVAASPLERAIIAEMLAVRDLLRGDAASAAERCLTLLDRVGHTSRLWTILLIALTHLRATAQIDHVLQRFARLSSEWGHRLAALLHAELDLCTACARIGRHALPILPASHRLTVS